MKFYSKNSNLLVVLRSGQPADQSTGRPMKPGIYVRFVDGIVEVAEGETLELMLKHKAHKRDFFEFREGERDPLADRRKITEPAHVMSEIKYGQIEKTVGGKVPIKFSPEQRAVMEEIVKETASKLAKEMVQKALAEQKEQVLPVRKENKDIAVVAESVQEKENHDVVMSEPENDNSEGVKEPGVVNEGIQDFVEASEERPVEEQAFKKPIVHKKNIVGRQGVVSS